MDEVKTKDVSFQHYDFEVIAERKYSEISTFLKFIISFKFSLRATRARPPLPAFRAAQPFRPRLLRCQIKYSDGFARQLNLMPRTSCSEFSLTVHPVTGTRRSHFL